MARNLSALLVAAVVSLVCPATEAKTSSTGIDRHFFTGLKGTYQLGIAHGATHHPGGVGLFFEGSVVHHWLELELAAGYRTDGHMHAIPIELVAKLPFYPHPRVNPFVGLGPLLSIVTVDGETGVFGGGTALVGSYFWMSEHWGLVAEVGYGLVYEHGLAHEVVVNAGLVYGW